jgi:hypothetical protein
MTEEQNGEDKMVYGFEDQKLIIRKLPKVGAVFGHLQAPTRISAKSAKQSRFSASSHVFVRPRVSIVETAQIKKRNQSPWGAFSILTKSLSRII